MLMHPVLNMFLKYNYTAEQREKKVQKLSDNLKIQWFDSIFYLKLEFGSDIPFVNSNIGYKFKY